MSRYVLIAMLTLVASTAGADAARDEAAVIEALHAACEAYRVGDAAHLERALDDRFTLTDTGGAVTGKTQELESVRAGEPRYEVFRNSDMKVRLYGDAAVVTGITTVKGEAAGKPFHSVLQFTDTLVRRGEEWAIAASHVSPAPTAH